MADSHYGGRERQAVYGPVVVLHQATQELPLRGLPDANLDAGGDGRFSRALGFDTDGDGGAEERAEVSVVDRAARQRRAGFLYATSCGVVACGFRQSTSAKPTRLGAAETIRWYSGTIEAVVQTSKSTKAPGCRKLPPWTARRRRGKCTALSHPDSAWSTSWQCAALTRMERTSAGAGEGPRAARIVVSANRVSGKWRRMKA